jgi:Protein of unknown function (DUF2510)
MTDTSGPSTPAGWFDDGSGRQRWWDGTAWSDHFADQQPAAVLPPAAASTPAETAPPVVPAPAQTAFPDSPAAPAAPVQPSTPGGEARPKKKHTGRNVFLIIAAVVVVIIIVSVAASGSGGKNTAASTSSTTGAAAGTSTPSPSPTANPYDKAYGTFTATTVSGTSDSVIPLPAGVKAGLITAKYTGADNFIVIGLDANNAQTTDLPVDTIGNYSGVTTWGLESIGNASTQLKVTATGPWTITLSPVSAAPASTPASGQGDSVFLYGGSAATWALSTNGSANFIVMQYSSSPLPNIAVDEIGSYSGSVPMNAGPSVVTIKADGSWTIGG